MNKQTQVHQLRAGESLGWSGERRGRIVLVSGEVLLQPPATQLAGITFVPVARRVAAPALLSLAELGGLRATQAATLVVEEAPTLFAVMAVALARLRRTRRESAILPSLTRGGAAW